MKFVKNNLIFLLVILISLILRFAIIQFGFHDDLLANAAWGEWIFLNGTKGFYENGVWIYSWPTQPPLISNIYGFNIWVYFQLQAHFTHAVLYFNAHNILPGQLVWYSDFVRWFGTTYYLESPVRIGALMSMKIIPILADLAVAVVIYFLGRKIDLKAAILSSTLYLFLPFSWYVSGLWGQYDQLMVLMLLVSFLLLYKKYFVLSALAMFLSFEIKPAIVYFLPFFSAYFFLQKPKIFSFVFSFLAVMASFWFTTVPFADSNPIVYTREVLFTKVFFAGRFAGLASRAFNFWQLISPQGGVSWSAYLGLPAFLWGYLILTFCYIGAIAFLRRENTLKGLFSSLYLIAGGSYLFGTGMLDRYFFPAAVIVIILPFFYPKIIKWSIATALLFSVNLLYSWGYPVITRYDAWMNDTAIRIFSLLQIAVFGVIIHKIGMAKTLYETGEGLIRSVKGFYLRLPNR